MSFFLKVFDISKHAKIVKNNKKEYKEVVTNFLEKIKLISKHFTCIYFIK